MVHDAPSIDALIQRAHAGDASATEQLFRWCKPLLDSCVLRHLGKRRAGIARPSDIAQNAAEKAFRGFAGFQGATQGELVSWLQRIAETCTREALRSAARKKRDSTAETPLDEPETASPQASPSHTAAIEEEWRHTLSQLYGLPEAQREAIRLHYLNDLRFVEVAARMDKTAAAVAGLVQRGVRTLRERLASAPDHEAADARAHAATPGQDAAGAALLEYLQRNDAGDALDAEAFIAEHPSCAEELRGVLSWIEQLEALRPRGPKR